MAKLAGKPCLGNPKIIATLGSINIKLSLPCKTIKNPQNGG
jgi:hypothetical protein